MDRELLKHAANAMETEKLAMQYDERGEYEKAIQQWNLTAQHLSQTEDIAVALNHEDTAAVKVHKREVINRIDHLNSLPPGIGPVAMKDMVSCMELTVPFAARAKSEAQAQSASSSSGASAGKTMGAAAAIGGTLGLIALGPFAALALAGGAAYACTRDDAIGEGVKTIGKATVSGAQKLAKVDEKHQISSRAAAAAVTVGSKAVQLGKDINNSETFQTVKKKTAETAGNVKDWVDKKQGNGGAGNGGGAANGPMN